MTAEGHSTGIRECGLKDGMEYMHAIDVVFLFLDDSVMVFAGELVTRFDGFSGPVGPVEAVFKDSYAIGVFDYALHYDLGELNLKMIICLMAMKLFKRSLPVGLCRPAECFRWSMIWRLSSTVVHLENQWPNHLENQCYC